MADSSSCRGAYIYLRQIALGLHQIGISGGSPIRPELLQGTAAVLSHGIQHIRHLKSDAVQSGPDNLRPSRGAAHTAQQGLCLPFPIRGGQTGKSRHQHACVHGICLPGQRLCLSRGSNQSQILFQPGDHRSRIVNVSLQHVGHSAAQPPGQGRGQAVPALHESFPDIHHHRRACPVSGLYHAAFMTSLPEQRRMGISQHGQNRNLFIQEALEVRGSETAVTVTDPGQGLHGDTENPAKLRIPGQRAQIEKLGAGCIGKIRPVYTVFR